jgi:hypothetical protein
MPRIGVLTTESSEATTTSAGSTAATATTTASPAAAKSTAAATATSESTTTTPAATAKSTTTTGATTVVTTATAAAAGSTRAGREGTGIHDAAQRAGDVSIVKAVALHVLNAILQVVLTEGCKPIDLALHTDYRDRFICRGIIAGDRTKRWEFRAEACRVGIRGRLVGIRAALDC